MALSDIFRNLFGGNNNQDSSTGVVEPLAAAASPALLSAAQLQQIMPYCPTNCLQSYAQCLSAAMQEGQITTKQRMACFLGQIAYESNQLRELSENLNYTVRALMLTWPSRFPTVQIAQQYAGQPVKLANYIYANRYGNGDTNSGDGWKFRGRSPIQLTFRNNYRAAGQYLSVDLENNPDFATDPRVGFRVAMWYWVVHNLNALADINDFVGITKAINGGTLGLQEREVFYQRAIAVL